MILTIDCCLGFASYTNYQPINNNKKVVNLLKYYVKQLNSTMNLTHGTKIHLNFLFTFNYIISESTWYDQG